MVAAGYILMAITCLVQQIFVENNSITTTQIIFLICNAVDSTLFVYGLTRMVDSVFLTSRRVIVESIYTIVVSIPLVVAAIYGGDEPQAKHVIYTLTICSIIIFLKQIFNYTTFRRHYLKAKAQLDNFYSSDMSGHLEWVNKSFVLFSALMALALICCTIPHFWVIVALIFIIWAVFLYIFISTINYAPRIMIIEEAFVDNNIAHDRESMPDNDGLIPIFSSLDRWVEQEGYLASGITISEVAMATGTNRNKISLHLNTYLNLNFREWITKLRLEKAKQLLEENPETSISDIAQQVSISNRSNFDKMFKKAYGLSPAIYRAKQR